MGLLAGASSQVRVCGRSCYSKIQNLSMKSLERENHNVWMGHDEIKRGGVAPDFWILDFEVRVSKNREMPGRSCAGSRSALMCETSRKPMSNKEIRSA